MNQVFLFALEVMGIAANNETNQAAVLSAFSEPGYEVCVQPVCASKAGIPMTRQRLHCVGINREKVPTAAVQIQELKSVWALIMAGKYPAHDLEEFLDEVDALQTSRTKVEKKSEDRQERKWMLQHKEVFESHEAGLSKGSTESGSEVFCS